MSKVVEINKLLNVIYELTTNIHSINKTFIKAEYLKKYYCNEISDFDDVFIHTEELDFLEINNNLISLSEHGKIFLNMMTIDNNKKILDSNDKQKQFLRELIIESKDLRKKYSKIFSKFRIDHIADPPIWCISANKIEGIEMPLMNFLEEIEILEKNENVFEIFEKFTPIISAIKNNTIMTLDEMERQLEYKKAIGNLGEKLTLDYEIDRLNKLDKTGELSQRITQISQYDPFAGFDVLSFNDECSNPSEPDRYIEVKTTTGTSAHFFWSRNEIKKAKECRVQYWIYIWINVNNDNKRLQIIQNPYKKLFEDSVIKPAPSVYEVGKKLLRDLDD